MAVEVGHPASSSRAMTSTLLIRLYEGAPRGNQATTLLSLPSFRQKEFSNASRLRRNINFGRRPSCTPNGPVPASCMILFLTPFTAPAFSSSTTSRISNLRCRALALLFSIRLASLLSSSVTVRVASYLSLLPMCALPSPKHLSCSSRLAHPFAMPCSATVPRGLGA